MNFHSSSRMQSSHDPTGWFAFRQERRGFTIVELVMAVAMIAMLLAVVGEMVVFTRITQRRMRQEATVYQAADNLLERITGLPWDAIQPDADFTKSLPDEFADDLAGATWDVAVTEETDPALAKRITVRVTRPSRGDRKQPTVCLTAWIYESMGGHDESIRPIP